MEQKYCGEGVRISASFSPEEVNQSEGQKKHTWYGPKNATSTVVCMNCAFACIGGRRVLNALTTGNPFFAILLEVIIGRDLGALKGLYHLLNAFTAGNPFW